MRGSVYGVFSTSRVAWDCSSNGDKLLLRLNSDGRPIANKYCEGKMKRTLKRELTDLKLLRRKRYASIIRRRLPKRGAWSHLQKGEARLANSRHKPAVIDKVGSAASNTPQDTSRLLVGRMWQLKLRALRRPCPKRTYRPVLNHGPRSLPNMRSVLVLNQRA